MTVPSPDNTADIPVWLNYVCSQANSASIGLIPLHALTMRVRLSDGGWTIGLEYQLSEVTDEDLDDMEEILDEFETSIGAMEGDNFTITSTYEVVSVVYGDPNDWGHVFSIFSRNRRIQLFPPELQRIPIIPWGDGEDNPQRRVRRKE